MAVKSTILVMLAAFGMLVVTGPGKAAEQNFITIGTGGVTGVYYPAGGAICRLVNKGRKTHGIRCSVESTGGSMANLTSIREMDIDLAVVQSDWQYHAYHGTSRFAGVGPDKNLRSLFSIHPEPFTVVARADAGIIDFEDLKGKRVNVGNPGSGQRATLEVLMNALGWDMGVFSEVSELKPAQQSAALCDNEIDAMVFTVGHPSGSIKEATTSCQSVVVNVAGSVVDQLVSDNDYYRTAVIPGGMYRNNENDVMTFGVGATIVATASLDADIVYQLVKAVFENFESFRKLHPALKVLNKEEMISDGLSAPLHEGAVRYYKEAGLM